MILKKMGRTIALIVLVSFFTAGCIGPFTLSRDLGRWNAGVGNKWGAELVFLGLLVLHVYQITALIDLLILNPITFWKLPNSGPMVGNGGAAEIELDKDHRAVLTFSEEGETLHADLFEQGRWIDTFTVTRNINGSLTAENKSGKVHYESRALHDGVRQVSDRQGTLLFSYSPDLIDRHILNAGRKHPETKFERMAGAVSQ